MSDALLEHASVIEDCYHYYFEVNRNGFQDQLDVLLDLRVILRKHVKQAVNLSQQQANRFDLYRRQLALGNPDDFAQILSLFAVLKSERRLGHRQCSDFLQALQLLLVPHFHISEFVALSEDSGQLVSSETGVIKEAESPPVDV